MKTTALLGSSTVANSALLLVKNKILALFLGPSGIGLISQLTNFSLIIQNWTALGMNTGVVRFVSEYHSKKQYDRLSRMLSTFVRVVLVSLLIFVITGILCSAYISSLLLDSNRYFNFIIIVLVGLPFLVFYNFFRSIFRGLLQIKMYVAAGIGSVVFGIVILIPLVHWFRLVGAVWQISLVALFGFFISYFLYRKIRPEGLRNSATGIGFDFDQFKELSKFGTVSLIAGSATLLAFLSVRTIVINHLGLWQLGLLQAAIAISTQSIQILIETISTYSYPRISGLLNLEDVRKEINETFRIAVFFVTCSVFFLLVFKEFVIVILYTTKFLDTVNILHFQLLGDYFKVVGWSFGVALLPLRRLKAFMSIDVLWAVVFVVISFFLVPKLGLEGAVIAYLVAFMLHALLSFLTIRNATGIHLTPANGRLFLLSTLLLLGTGFFFRLTIANALVFGILFLIWVKLTITRSEWVAVWSIVKKIPESLRSKY